VWRKKFKTGPKSREEWAKQARFMQSRGFGFDMIKKVLSTAEAEEND
jgi:regulatory protein